MGQSESSFFSNKLSVNASQDNVNIPDESMNELYDDATAALMAAQEAMKIAEAAVADLDIHDYDTQHSLNLQQGALRLCGEAVSNLEQSKAKLNDKTLEDIPIAAMRKLCHYLSYKDTASLRLCCKTVLFIHKDAQDLRFKMCYLKLPLKEDFPVVECPFLVPDFQLSVHFPKEMEEKTPNIHSKDKYLYDKSADKIKTYLLANKDRIRRISMDSHIFNQQIEAILKIPRLEHLTLNQDQDQNESKYDKPILSELFEKHCDWLTSLDVRCLDLTHLKHFNFNFKNLSTLVIGLHCKGWRHFVTSVVDQSANTLTTLRLSDYIYVASIDEDDIELSITKQLPNLTHLTLEQFKNTKKNPEKNTQVFPEVARKVCSTVKYLSLENVSFHLEDIPVMPQLQKLSARNIPYPHFRALGHKMPNLREMEIGELERVDEYNEDPDESVRMPNLTTIKILDDNISMSNRLLILGLTVAESSLKHVYVYSGDCMMYCRNLMKFRPGIVIHELELPKKEQF